MALLSRLGRWLGPILVALYGVYYWDVIADRRYFTGDVSLQGKVTIVTGRYKEL